MAGKRFIEQSVRCVSASGDVRAFEFHWTKHWEQFGGAAAETGASLLELDAQWRPLSYAIFRGARGVRHLKIAGGQIEATLSDDSIHNIALEAAPDLVFQRDLAEQLAIYLAATKPNVPTTLKALDPDTLKLEEFTVIPEPDGWYSCSLKFALRIGADNQLSEMRFEGGGRLFEETAPSLHAVPLPALRAPREHVLPDLTGVQREEVIIDGDDTRLGAQILKPAGDAGISAVCLFLQGSGALDRHGQSEIFDTGQQKLMGSIVSAAGVALVSLDTRGTGRSGFGRIDTDPFQTRVADARSAMTWLQEANEFGSIPIGVIGHSLGAIAALSLLSGPTWGHVRAAALLACPARGLGRIVSEQMSKSARSRFADRQEVLAQQRQALAEWLRKLRDPRRQRSQAELLASNLDSLLQPDVLRLVPKRMISTVHCPLLIAQGQADPQVSAARDAIPLFDAATGPAELRLAKGLDHFFGFGGRSPESLSREGGRFIAGVAHWLRDQLQERAAQ